MTIFLNRKNVITCHPYTGEFESVKSHCSEAMLTIFRRAFENFHQFTGSVTADEPVQLSWTVLKLNIGTPKKLYYEKNAKSVKKQTATLNTLAHLPIFFFIKVFRLQYTLADRITMKNILVLTRQ